MIGLGVKKIRIESLGEEVSRLGFGAMRLPITEDGKINREEASRMIDRAYRAGVNYFDTAWGYHAQESQVFLAEALKKYPRESYKFATKLPIWLCGGTREGVEQKFNEQLERCKLDCVDFYLVHSLDQDRYDDFVKSEAHAYLLEQKKAGRIKHLGFSFHGNYETFQKLLDHYQWDFVQIQINFVDDVMIEAGKLYQLLCERGIPTIVMEPVRGGFLANPPQVAVDEMNTLGQGLSPAAWALRWCMDKDNMKVILSGMTTMEQVEDNLKTFSEYPEKLTPEEAGMLHRARDLIMGVKTVPCTACGYCMDCPFGVDIPGVFRVYNQYKLFPNKFRTGVNYGFLKRESHDATQCTRCGACLPLCPQSIAIPDRLAEVHGEIGSF